MTSQILTEYLRRTVTLRALARELVGDADAEDLVQEVAVQSMLAPPRREGPVGGWFVGVLRNLAGKHRRSVRTRLAHEARVAATDEGRLDPSAEDADALRRLTEVVTGLPEPYRGVVLARYFREETPSEIAAATETPVATVKTRLQRGLALLRERLEEQDGDWRARLTAAFALGARTAERGPLLGGMTMKTLLVAAILVPVGVWMWGGDAGPGGAPADGGGRPVAGTTGVPEKAVVAADAIGNSAGAEESAPSVTGRAARLSDTAGAKTPIMRLDMAGPAAFRSAFRNTNLGQLFASQPGEDLWRPLLAPVDRLWQTYTGVGEAGDRTRARVLDYAGRVRVRWFVHPGGDGEPDRLYGACALSADEDTDLAALAGDLSGVMARLFPGEAKEQEFGTRKLRVMAAEGGDSITIPVVLGGSVVAFFGPAALMETAVPRCLQALAQKAPAATAPLRFAVDLEQLRGLSFARQAPPVARLLGLESLRSLEFTVRPAQLRVVVDVGVEFGDGDRGMFAGLLPDIGSLPKMLARVPKAATPWLTLPLRPGIVFKQGLATEAAMQGRTEAETRETWREDLGLEMDRELLDHLSGEVMVLGDLWRTGDRKVFEDGDDPPLGACVAWSVGDSAAFERGFEKMMKKAKGAVQRFETRDVDGVKITRMGTMLATGVHMAVGKGLFAIAFGKEGVTQLEALVAGNAVAPADARLPAAVLAVQAMAPMGWNGIGVADLTALLGGQATLALEALDDALPAPMRFHYSSDEVQGKLDRLLPLIAKHKLANIVTMMGYHRGRWHLRSVW